MVRLLLGSAICIAVGFGTAVTGLGGRIPFSERVVPAAPPAWLAARPETGRVAVTLVRSEGLVEGLARGLSSGQIALHRRGSLALVDGRIFTVSPASTREVLHELAWDDLPIDARSATIAEIDRFTAPAPAPFSWRARQRAHALVHGGHDLLRAHPGACAAALLTGFGLLVHAFARRIPARAVADETFETAPVSPWRRRRAAAPVRVVLVPDVDTLRHVRIAIGEEHIVASTQHAFAFADGWILAARKGSVFELVSELGWRMRPLEMATRQELVGEGHALSPLAGDDPADALDLLEALHVCGPVAHGCVPRLASSTLSPA